MKFSKNTFCKIKFAIINLQFAMLIAGCANVVSPEGGVRDNDAPKLVKANPNNASTNVTENKFRIMFDEFIKLKETEVIVSPPLNHPLKVKQKGKYIDVKWTDTLKPNTTYTFNFADNIVDYTEGNPYSNFKYVFSTGAKIDTLELSGKVVDASTNKGLEKIAVMLYQEQSDSIVCKTKPYYFTKTDANGLFHFSYLKEGNYKLFALKDENYNLLFDLANEKIAFFDSIITISKTNKNRTLSMFQNYFATNQKIKSSNRIDIFSYLFKFEKPLTAADQFLKLPENIATTLVTGDSILFYFKQKPSKDSFQFDFKNSTIDTFIKAETKYDSIQLKRSRLFVVANFENLNSKEDKRKSASINKPSETKQTNNILNFGKKLSINFSHPVAKNNLPTSFILIEDTGKLKTFASVEAFDSSDVQLHAKINYPFKEDHTYELIGRKNQFTDVCNLYSDSFHIKFVYAAQKHFGNIYISLDSTFNQPNFYVELLNGNQQIIKHEKINTNHISWKNIQPGSYSIRILNDSNADGIWTTGNYFKHIQPENYIYYPKEIIVKPNWDNELEWKNQ